MTHRRNILSALLATLLPLAALAQPAADLSPEQAGRPRAQKLDEAVKLAKDFKFQKEGVLVVGTTTGRLPFAAYATDTKTPVGNAPDIAQLVADSLGRKLELVSTAWADWPLGLQSGKFDVVVSNVTVTEERKEKFDFSTYRNDQIGIYVKSDSKLGAIKEPKDIAGLKVIVSASTNQEQILLRWKYLALVGLLGIGCYNAFQYLALTSSTPINVTLIAASSSLWMLLVGWIGFRVRPNWRQALGALFSIAGVLFVLSRGTLQALLTLRFVAGDVYMVLATLAWAVYSWMLTRPPASMRGDARPRWNWAEFLLVPDARANLAPIPDGLSDEDVLLVPDIFSTGLSGAESGGVRVGDAVAVFAQGPIGLCATAGARLRGASLIIGIDAIEKR